jgi:hypothetical protein
LRTLCAVGALGLAAGPATAQIWIGQIAGEMAAQSAQAAEQACRLGAAMPEDEIAEARQPALAAMAAYFDAARAARPFADQFHLDRGARWTAAGASAVAGQIAAQADPFARAGLTLDPSPLGFVRAGDGKSALGQWRVRDAAGVPAGTYTGYFKRKSGVWRFSTLTLSAAHEYADPVVQYCHDVGDVLPYRIQYNGQQRAWLERRIAKLEKNLVSANRDAQAARANADRRGAGQMDEALARDEARRARRLAEEIAQLREALTLARTAEADALADAKAAEDAKAAARGENATQG